MQTDYIIDHELKFSDIEEIRELAREAGVFNEIEIDMAACLADERLSSRDESYCFVIARNDNGNVIGYSCFGEIPLTDSRYDLYWIIVSPKMQGSGISSKLMEETEKAVAKIGGKHIYAETSGTDAYIAARKFYLKNGYEQAAVLKEFYRAGDDKYIFYKKL